MRGQDVGTSLSAIHDTSSGCHATEVSQGVVTSHLRTMLLTPPARSVAVFSREFVVASPQLSPSRLLRLIARPRPRYDLEPLERDLLPRILTDAESLGVLVESLQSGVDFRYLA